MKSLPRWLLLALVTRHYLWPLMPDSMQTSVWTIASALVFVVGIFAFTVFVVAVCDVPIGATLLVSAWWIVEELFVAGCEIAYLLRPLMPIGDERCTAQLGWKFSAFGLFMVALLIPATIDTYTKREGSENER